MCVVSYATSASPIFGSILDLFEGEFVDSFLVKRVSLLMFVFTIFSELTYGKHSLEWFHTYDILASF